MASSGSREYNMGGTKFLRFFHCDLSRIGKSGIDENPIERRCAVNVADEGAIGHHFGVGNGNPFRGVASPNTRSTPTDQHPDQRRGYEAFHGVSPIPPSEITVNI